jgi:hypothetical protein
MQHPTGPQAFRRGQPHGIRYSTHALALQAKTCGTGSFLKGATVGPASEHVCMSYVGGPVHAVWPGSLTDQRSTINNHRAPSVGRRAGMRAGHSASGGFERVQIACNTQRVAPGYAAGGPRDGHVSGSLGGKRYGFVTDHRALRSSLAACSLAPLPYRTVPYRAIQNPTKL